MCKGSLSLDGNQTLSVKAKGSLTARPTSRAGAKAGLSDPTVPCGRAVAQRIKVTLGINVSPAMLRNIGKKLGELSGKSKVFKKTVSTMITRRQVC